MHIRQLFRVILPIACAWGCGASSAPGVPDADTQPDALPVIFCDTLKRDCNDPFVTKCTLLEQSAFSRAAECVVPTGSQKDGDSCARSATGLAGVGHDNCSGGLFCSESGFATDPNGNPTALACRRFCDSSQDCDGQTGERCRPIGTCSTHGVCLPSCQVFGPPCSSGMTCRLEITYDSACPPVPTAWDGTGTCETPGTLKEGDSCFATVETCGAGLFCYTDSRNNTRCYQPCDTLGGMSGTHPCPNGQTCTRASGVPGLGVCSPP
jgi:hypothetical protein